MFPDKRLVNRKHSGMLGELDDLVQRFFKATPYKGDLVNTSIFLATAKNLTHHYP